MCTNVSIDYLCLWLLWIYISKHKNLTYYKKITYLIQINNIFNVTDVVMQLNCYSKLKYDIHGCVMGSFKSTVHVLPGVDKKQIYPSLWIWNKYREAFFFF